VTDYKQKTILLVEDDAIVAMMEAAQLEGEGYKIITAMDGLKAIEIVRAKAPAVDLILMDIDLGGGIDGTETAREILKEDNLPILFLSSHIEKEIVEKTEKITSYGYVVKNSEMTVLDASIKMAFRLFESKIKQGEHNNALRASEARFNMLAEQNRTIAWELDARGMYAYVSQAVETIFGYSPAELVGKKYFYDIHPEKGREEFKIAIFSAFERHERFSDLENPIQTKDGRVIWVSTNCIPRLDADGNLTGYYGSDTDITERRRDREALKKSEEKFKQLIKNSYDTVVLLDANGIQFFVGESGEKIHGYKPEEVTNISVIEMIHPDDRAHVTQAFKNVVKNVSGSVQYRHKHKNGGWVYLEAVGTNQLDNPFINAVVINVRDITERKRAEDELQKSQRRLNDVIDFFPDATLAIDNEKRIIVWNKAIERMTGLKAENMIGKGNYEYTIPFYGERRSQFMDIIWDSASDVIEKYSNIITYDGDSMSAEAFCPALYGGRGANIFVKVSPLHDQKGDIIGVIESIRDITEQKRAEEKIRNLLREKELILKEVHHRVKNNMNTIFGLLTLQAAAQENQASRNILNDASGRVRSMMVLYDKLYRAENESAVSMKEYLPALVNEIASIFPQKALVKIETRVDDIVLNANLLSPLGIIINELITNSMKYAFAERNNGIITIIASKKEDGVSIIFEDDGSGIPEHVTFENSTGFGLQLIKMLVQQIGGSIAIERTCSSRFIIEF